MNEVIFWLILACVAIIIDLCTSAFLFVWFAIGGLIALIASFLGVSFGIQMVIFAIVSCIAVAIGYPWAKKRFNKNIERTPLMEETYIGKIFVAEEVVKRTTRLKVGGIYWTGVNKGEPIEKGQKFKIIGIDGTKFIIEALKEE